MRARSVKTGAGARESLAGLGRSALLGIATALALAVFVAPRAQAAPPLTIAGWGHGAGKVDSPESVAVDQSSGDLYVADGNNFRVERFDAEGHFLLAWGAGVADGKSEELQACGPAAEPPTERCFQGLSPTGTHGEEVPAAVSPSAVAVEQSTGDVYVAEGGNPGSPGRVQKFAPTGALISLLGPDVTFSGLGDAGASETQALTVKATAGTFTLSLTAPAPFGAGATKQTTAPIPYNASHEALQAALEALPNVEAGDLTVTGGPGDAGGSTPYQVHFVGGPYAHNYVAPMGAGTASLLGSQTITVQGATGGAFKLAFKGKETAPTPYNATHEEVQSKLEALSTIGAGNVSVSGSAGGPWTVTFAGALAGSPQSAISASAKGTGYELTPSSASVAVAPPAAVSIPVPGGGPEVCEPSRGDVCKRAGGTGAIAGEFGTLPDSLAFDGEGKLWVNDGGRRAQRFDPDGAFLEEVPLPSGTKASALAIDPTSEDFYALGSAGNNEVQYVSAPGGGSGEFTLSFEGQTTAPLPAREAIYSGPELQKGLEAAEAIQKALEALPAIGPGDIAVVPANRAFIVVFVNHLGGRDVPQLLASGGSPPVTVETINQGQPGSVEKLDPTGALLETLDDEAGDVPRALATDASGRLYVGDDVFPYRLLRFSPSGEQESQFGVGQIPGGIYGNGGPNGNALAVDEAGETLYAASSIPFEDDYSMPEKEKSVVRAFDFPQPGPLPEGLEARDLEPTSATLAATLNPEGHQTHYRFQYLSRADFEAHGFEECGLPANPGCAETPEEQLPGEGFEAEEISAEVEALIPATEYRFRLLAENEKGEVEPEATFEAPAAVGIEAQWVSALAAHDATLSARLDPLGVKAQWWLEYDTSPYGEGEGPHAHGMSVPVPPGELPASFGAVPVAVALRGLEGSTAYHYRFVAEDEREVSEGGETVKRAFTTYGPDQSFTTQPAGLGSTLPDDRAWEMVSPPEKHGGRITSPNGLQGGEAQAAANGNALAYLSFGSLEADPLGSRVIEESSQLARRGPGGSWSTVDLTPPHTEIHPLAIGEGLEYKLFSTNLESALLQPRDATPLSPQTTERTPYLRQNTAPPAYTPLLTASNVPGIEFGKPLEDRREVNGNVSVVGASPDLRHVVLGSKVPLTEAGHGPYVWTAGQLQEVGIRPTGEAAASGSASIAVSTNRISANGSRVFWASGGLYLRDTAHEETIRLDDAERFGGFGTGEVGPLFQGASADGSVAFFTDTQNLTPDANEEGADLYRWRAQGTHGCAQAGGCLEDLSAGVLNFGESAEALGVLPGIAANGSAAYLVARGVLDGRPNAEGESAAPGQPNLYAWSEAGGMRFVATLGGEDSTDWGRNGTAWSLTAEASPSGRYLAFMSALPLTGYDNRDASSGEAAEEVFRYDSQAEELACVSCNPSSARPQALVVPESLSILALDPQFLWRGRAVAAVVPEATSLYNGGPSLYRPRYTHDDGRVFFDAADSLVAADSNGTGDVYEYEPTGTGSCGPAAADAGTALVPGGCVSLLSSGHATGLAAFLDSDESGDNAFFYTPAQLSVTDEDGEVDVYDARVGGEPARLEPQAECQGEACQPPASPPQTQTPASATFRGPGNVREAAPRRKGCPKGRRKMRRNGRVHCVKKGARKRHSRHRRKQRSHRNGRTHR